MARASQSPSGMKTSILASILMAASVSLFACGEADEAFDCASICNSYDECVKDTDVVACTSTCEDNADESEAFADRADDCETCLDDQDSCLEDLPCAVECAFLVE
jgi:tRNA C32,U32 (ribose-2'-O)-methylase TrmJ